MQIVPASIYKSLFLIVAVINLKTFAPFFTSRFFLKCFLIWVNEKHDIFVDVVVWTTDGNKLLLFVFVGRGEWFLYFPSIHFFRNKHCFTNKITLELISQRALTRDDPLNHFGDTIRRKLFSFRVLERGREGGKENATGYSPSRCHVGFRGWTKSGSARVLPNWFFYARHPPSTGDVASGPRSGRDRLQHAVHAPLKINLRLISHLPKNEKLVTKR